MGSVVGCVVGAVVGRVVGFVSETVADGAVVSFGAVVSGPLAQADKSNARSKGQIEPTKTFRVLIFSVLLSHFEIVFLQPDIFISFAYQSLFWLYSTLQLQICQYILYLFHVLL